MTVSTTRNRISPGDIVITIPLPRKRSGRCTATEAYTKQLCLSKIYRKALKNGIGPDKRIIKGRPFEVGFDRSHQPLQQGAPL